MAKTKSKGQPPVAELKDGLLRVSIFKSEPKKEGDFVRFSGKLTRAYQDASGTWHSTEYMSGPDYLRAANLLTKAYDTERTLRDAERHATAPEPEEF